MNGNGVAKPVGHEYNRGEHSAQSKGIESLMQVPMEEAESGTTDQDSRSVTKDSDAIQQEAAENKFLCYGGDDHESQDCSHRRQGRLNIGNSVGGSCSGNPLQQCNNGCRNVGEKVPGAQGKDHSEETFLPCEGRGGERIYSREPAEQEWDQYQAGQVNGDVIEDHQRGVAHPAEQSQPAHYHDIG